MLSLLEDDGFEGVAAAHSVTTIFYIRAAIVAAKEDVLDRRSGRRYQLLEAVAAAV